MFFFFFSSRRRHTRLVSDWSSDVCSSDLDPAATIWDDPGRGGVGSLQHVGNTPRTSTYDVGPGAFGCLAPVWAMSGRPGAGGRFRGPDARGGYGVPVYRAKPGWRCPPERVKSPPTSSESGVMVNAHTPKLPSLEGVHGVTAPVAAYSDAMNGRDSFASGKLVKCPPT